MVKSLFFYMIFTIDARNGFVLKKITLKYFSGILVIFLLFFISECYSQTLWGVDIQDFDSPSKWGIKDGIYFKGDIEKGDFDGIQFIPTVGFVFYMNEAGLQDMIETYDYLTNEFGKRKNNKDYIPPDLKDSIDNKQKFEEYIDDGRCYIFREWVKNGIIVRLFWNQYRFWVEVINRNYK
ncbi:MAG: hypothetical protein ISS16_10640 [Ignavibacteria bacterium]|nr:hypothetical protein [Ignavibacteria bacterium]